MAAWWHMLLVLTSTLSCYLALVFLTLSAPELRVQAADASSPSLSQSLTGLDLSPLLPIWNSFYGVSVGVGYKSNVLLARNEAESSGFAATRLDFILWRRPIEDGREFLLSITGADRRYWASESITHDDVGLAHARYLHELGEHWQGVLELDGSYLDQVLDTSFNDSPRARRRVQGAVLGGTPGMRWRFNERDWIQLSPVISRTWLRSPYDSYSDLGGQLSWGHNYGMKSDWRLEYTGRARLQDDSRQATLSGVPLPGSDLQYQRHDFQWADHHYWDAAKRIHTSTRIGGRLSYDNGPGYYDSWRVWLAEQLQYRLNRWEFTFEGGVSFSRYPQQQVGSQGESRRFTEWSGLARIERRLGLRWKLYGDFSYERSQATDAFEAFTASTVETGIRFEF